MKRLISIQTVPVKVELRKKEAKIEYVNAKAEMQMTTQKGGWNMKTKAAKLHTETFLVPEKTVEQSISEYSQKGMQVAESAAAEDSRRGRAMGEANAVGLIQNYARQDNFKNIKMNIGIRFIPERAPEVTFEEGGLQAQYQADKLQFDWKMTEQELNFEHAQIDLVVTQKPDVIIDYIGDPVYVPPSSNPNYTPINTKG